MQSENTFEFYRDFLNLDEANAFTSMLKANNIEHSLETSDTVIDDMVGQKYFVYDEKTRKIGKIILYLGGSILTLELFLLQFVNFREYVDQFYFSPFESF